jgi:hypothetical protein
VQAREAEELARAAEGVGVAVRPFALGSPLADAALHRLIASELVGDLVRRPCVATAEAGVGSVEAEDVFDQDV